MIFSTPKNYKLGVLLLTVLFLSLFAGNTMAIEEPKYAVIEKTDDFELRAYEPKIIAEVTVSGGMKQASSRGFRLIADFIFGNNTATSGDSKKINMTVPVTMETEAPRVQSKKISMTTPVTMKQHSALEQDQWLMHFVMPSEFTMATLPKPNNPKVKVRQIPETKYAVIRFSGFSGTKKVGKKTNELLAWMEQQGIEPAGNPELARYNPPITPPFFRRNEVMVKYQ